MVGLLPAWPRAAAPLRGATAALPPTAAALGALPFPPSLQLRLFVCNNDDTIKVYGLSGGTLATVLRCPVAINYCALSPSGR